MCVFKSLTILNNNGFFVFSNFNLTAVDNKKLESLPLCILMGPHGKSCITFTLRF